MAREWWDPPATPFSSRMYWTKAWRPIGNSPIAWAIINVRNKEGFWVSPDNCFDGSQDIGPFDTFEAAAACFETLVGLD